LKAPIYSDRVRVRSCGLIVRDESLLLIRLKAPTRSAPIWMPPGGEVRPGESLEEALRREVHEETGLKVDPVRLALVHQFVEPPWHAIEFYFFCNGPQTEPRAGVDPERPEEDQILLETAYHPLSTLHKLDLHPGALQSGNHTFFSAEGDIIHTKSIRSNQ